VRALAYGHIQDWIVTQGGRSKAKRAVHLPALDFSTMTVSIESPLIFSDLPQCSIPSGIQGGGTALDGVDGQEAEGKGVVHCQPGNGRSDCEYSHEPGQLCKCAPIMFLSSLCSLMPVNLCSS
jgi:hypothetical protein